MRQVVLHVAIPFITGFGLGGAFCAGLCILDVGGLWTLICSTDMQMNLVVEFVRFASLFGILSVATHHAFSFVCDR